MILKEQHEPTAAPKADSHGSQSDGVAHSPFEASHLIGHVKDATYFEVPRLLATDGHLQVPQFRSTTDPLVDLTTGTAALDDMIEPLDMKVTKFMILEVIGAVLVAVIFIRLAKLVRTGSKPRGKFWNFFEAMLLFIRDDVARPAIGKHDADRFLPFIWTIFFFVLGCNLLGMVPWAGSPTGALATTGMLALITFVTVIGAGSAKLGPIGFWKAQVPHMDLPFILALFLIPGIFVIEVLGLLIKHFVLAVRLLANMMAGHLVLAVILAFIAASWGTMAGIMVVPASILGATALSCLELFVAFLQAYIFAFLASLFIGMAVHPH
jgi:F-type H+-transporting ATPase subunit a